MLNKALKITTTALILALSAQLAHASSNKITLTDSKKAEITSHLEAMGYEIGKIKIEDGLYEAYAKKDGQKLEIFLDDEMEIQYIKGNEKLALNDKVKSEIAQTLEAQGYSVGKIKIEDGLYEAYAKKDGQKLEIFLDQGMNIVRVKQDD